ncbi:MAG: hypothetical protein OXG72_18155, partial [Acidobacteria bacterium]|nr:hypothetical protein [Acidobacteriota bacterium]
GIDGLSVPPTGANAITRAQRTDSTSPGLGQWNLTGTADSWGTQPVLRLGAVSALEEEVISRLSAGGTIVASIDDRNWASYSLRANPTFSGAGASRIARFAVQVIASRGNHRQAQLTVQMTPAGADGLQVSTPTNLAATGTYSAAYPVAGQTVRAISCTPTWTDVDGADRYRVGLSIVGGNGYVQFFRDVDSGDELRNPIGWGSTVPGQMVVTVEAIVEVGDETFVSGAARIVIRLRAAVSRPGTPASISVTITDSTAPGAIRIVAGASARASSYVFERSVDGGRTWTEIADQAGRTFTDSGLAAGGYRYRVRGRNAGGDSNARTSTTTRTITAAPAVTLTVSISASPSTARVARSARVTLTANVGGTATGAVTYAWYDSDDKRLGTGSRIVVTAPSDYDESERYEVDVRRQGISRSAGYTVRTVEAPTATRPSIASASGRQSITDGRKTVSISVTEGAGTAANSIVVEQYLGSTTGWINVTTFTRFNWSAGSFSRRAGVWTGSWSYDSTSRSATVRVTLSNAQGDSPVTSVAIPNV